MTTHIDQLPTDALERVLAFVGGSQLVALRRVCRRWNRIISELLPLMYKNFRVAMTLGRLKWCCPTRIELEVSPDPFKCRVSHACCYWAGTVYVFGGGVMAGKPILSGSAANEANLSSDTFFNDLMVYDLRSEKWSRLLLAGSPPCPRKFCSMVAVDDRLLIYGGFVPIAGNRFQACQASDQLVYADLKLHKWNEIDAPPSAAFALAPQHNQWPPPLGGHCISVARRRQLMFLFGGCSVLDLNVPICKQLWRLDLTNWKWKLVADADRFDGSLASYSMQTVDSCSLLIVCQLENENRICRLYHYDIEQDQLSNCYLVGLTTPLADCFRSVLVPVVPVVPVATMDACCTTGAAGTASAASDCAQHCLSSCNHSLACNSRGAGATAKSASHRRLLIFDRRRLRSGEQLDWRTQRHESQQLSAASFGRRCPGSRGARAHSVTSSKGGRLGSGAADTFRLLAIDLRFDQCSASDTLFVDTQTVLDANYMGPFYGMPVLLGDFELILVGAPDGLPPVTFLRPDRPFTHRYEHSSLHSKSATDIAYY